MTFKTALIITCLSICTFFSAGWAQVPALMNYQGRILDNGNLVTSNNVSIILSLYDGSGGGATLLYQEQDTVNVVDGLYSTTIGDNPETAGAAYTELSEALAAGGASTWLGIALDGRAECSPRGQILSTAFALQAIENDPAFAASTAAGITPADTANWNEAHGWGNHADAGYLTSAGGAYLPLTGGTMTGDIDLDGHQLQNAVVMPGGDLTMGTFNQGAP